MPKKIDEKVVFDSKWLQVVQATIEGEGGKQSPYFYHRYPWSSSLGIAILCYRDVEIPLPMSDENEIHREYLGRFEYLPAQSEGLTLCSITGGYDKPDKESFCECAIRELEEEGGYTTSTEHVVSLGKIRNSKSSDNVMHLFAVNVKDCTKISAVGDGTIGEEGSYSEWLSHQDILFADDVLLAAMIARLNHIRPMP